MSQSQGREQVNEANVFTPEGVKEIIATHLPDRAPDITIKKDGEPLQPDPSISRSGVKAVINAYKNAASEAGIAIKEAGKASGNNSGYEEGMALGIEAAIAAIEEQFEELFERAYDTITIPKP